MKTLLQEEDHHHGAGSFLGRSQAYLGEFVYGGIDGSVTTFAVVAGSVGAGLSAEVIIILGFANLLADGFAMSVGAYLSSHSERQNYEKHRRIEYWEIENLREKEVEEIRKIYAAKGFEGDLLDRVVSVITADEDRWVDAMMTDELGMALDPRPPVMIGLVTYLSFIAVGLIPLTIYVGDYFMDQFTVLPEMSFLITCTLTSLAFIGIGLLKTYVTQTLWFRSVMETWLLGAIAAGVAYFVGDFLEQIILN